jgi:PAS domain-containing protein
MPAIPLPDLLQLAPSVLGDPRSSGVVVVDREGVVVAWTLAVESLLDLPAERVLGQPLGTVPVARVALWEAMAEIARVTGTAQRLRRFEVLHGPQAGARVDVGFHPLVSRSGARDGVLIRIDEEPGDPVAAPRLSPRRGAVEDGIARARRRVRSEQRKLRDRIDRVEAEAGELETLAGAILDRNAVLEDAAAAFRGLDAATRAISGGGDVPAVLAEFCARGRELLHADVAVAALREPTGDLRWFGPEGGLHGGPPATSALADACRRVIACGEPLVVEVPAAGDGPADLLRAAVVAPLRGGPAGVLLCAWRSRRSSSASELWIAETLGSRAGEAVRALRTAGGSA